MKKLDPIVPFYIHEKMMHVFGSEWDALSPQDKALIVRDCTEEGGVSDFAQYRRNIGGGNLYSYVKTMRVRFERKR